MKHWFQTESSDLINWENKGVAIKPNYSFESHGIYSGSGLVHSLTIPRELSVEENILYQRPVHELKKKRKKEDRAAMKLSTGVENLGTLTSNSFEMICDVEVEIAQRAGLKLRVGEGEGTLLYLDTLAQKVVLDRTETGAAFAQEYGTIEVFVNDSEIVFTSRLFPKKESQGIQFFVEEGSATIDAVQWTYK